MVIATSQWCFSLALEVQIGVCHVILGDGYSKACKWINRLSSVMGWLPGAH